ncbi:MAG: YncE family protein, partial [Lysobacteraceae bacterium]
MQFLHVTALVAAISVPTAMADVSAPSVSTNPDVQRFVLGGTGGWDDLVVDSVAHRLYLSRSDRVMVVNTLDGKLAGEVPNTNGVHGIALVPERNIGFTSNGKSDTVTVFDLKTLKPLGDIKVSGSNPDAIVYDPATKRVITFNGRSANATLIDAGTRTVVGTIALDGKPEFARADGHGRV